MRELLLDAEALVHNLHQVKLHAPRAKILAMVKANAYGHGLTWTATQLAEAGADGFGVASLSEADCLHRLNLKQPLVLMSGVQTAAELEHALSNNYAIILHSEYQLRLLEQQIGHKQRITIWLKVDTGMHRLGFKPDQILGVWQRLYKLKIVNQPIILTTHFAKADESDQLATKKQIDLFYGARATLPKSADCLNSLANSAAIIAWPETHADWVRPGIMLYGSSPFSGQLPAHYNLKPVMTVRSSIISCQNFSAGSAIGYGGTFICPQPMRIAVVAFGYGDGYPRHAYLSKVLIKGHQCQVVGRISMDMLQVDITEFPEIKTNDMVTFWGPELPAEQLAINAETLSYELFCRLQHHRLTQLIKNQVQ